eukprot:m.501753 g.501753  ORF g.501753 m.501753 type:complete len:173 (-) comp65076_c0_seq1:28-546(-)
MSQPKSGSDAVSSDAVWRRHCAAETSQRKTFEDTWGFLLEGGAGAGTNAPDRARFQTTARASFSLASSMNADRYDGTDIESEPASYPASLRGSARHCVLPPISTATSAANTRRSTAASRLSSAAPKQLSAAALSMPTSKASMAGRPTLELFGRTARGKLTAEKNLGWPSVQI